jgi:hypothetical protein
MVIKNQTEKVILENWDGDHAYLDREELNYFELQGKGYLYGKILENKGINYSPHEVAFKIIREGEKYQTVVARRIRDPKILKRLYEISRKANEDGEEIFERDLEKLFIEGRQSLEELLELESQEIFENNVVKGGKI